mmetsp:Transcript_11120/g.24536  ORF Transcript_11120/g.24536 Transcript_11120/m.24536 type:complete len:201 (-) Transcript_11120:709-1311(-)
MLAELRGDSRDCPHDADLSPIPPAGPRFCEHCQEQEAHHRRLVASNRVRRRPGALESHDSPRCFLSGLSSDYDRKRFNGQHKASDPRGVRQRRASLVLYSQGLGCSGASPRGQGPCEGLDCLEADTIDEGSGVRSGCQLRLRDDGGWGHLCTRQRRLRHWGSSLSSQIDHACWRHCRRGLCLPGQWQELCLLRHLCSPRT